MTFARSTVVRMITVSGTCALLWLVPAAVERPAMAAGGESRVRMTWDWTAEATDRAGRRQRVPMVRDFSERQLIASEVVPARLVPTVSGNARFWQQYLRRHARRLASYDRGRNAVPDPNADLAAARDWSFSLNNGSGGTIAQPAKYVYDINAAPSCTNDFVVTGVNIAGAATQANMVGLNSLYNMPAGNGLCSGTAPKVMFAYNIGPGVINSYIQLSLDGTKVAFNENGTNSYLHILRWATGAGNGTSAAAAATPGSGNSAADVKLLLTAGTSTAPYVDYDNDVAYVTTNDNVVHKFSGVFLGTPKEVTAAGTGWPVSTGLGGATASLSTPVYDPVSKHVFFTDSDNGGLDYVDDSVAPAVSVTNKFFFAPGLAVAAPVMIDMTNQKVYAFSPNPGGGAAVVSQADTNLSVASQVTVDVGGASSNYAPLMGDFTEDYYNGNSGSALLYVVGNNAAANRLPSLYAIGFNAAFKMNPTYSFGPLPLTTNTAGIGASPVTAFYNSTLNKQFLFISVTNRCTTTITGGCIRSIDVTSGFPTAASINNVVLAATGGTGGISIDNVSSAAGASSVYYTTLTGRTLIKATQAGLQ
jgi:hypothetical protein